MKLIKLSVSTDGTQAGSTTGDTVVGGGCALFAVDYFPGTIATGATITLTDETGGASFTLLVKASAGTSNVRFFPRVQESQNTDGSDLGTFTLPLVTGKPKIAVASGGDTKTGYVVLHLMEL
jgi:hypothetical protein